VVGSSHWDRQQRLLVTQLTGTVDVDDVDAWRLALLDAVERIPDGTSFKLLLDLTGYEPASLDAHRHMRMVVPDLLIAHGLRPAFVDLYPDAPEPVVIQDRGVVCVAFANVHHDETKMARYEEQIATANQRFFTSRSAAEEWLATV
jgi:hypothetical protein